MKVKTTRAANAALSGYIARALTVTMPLPDDVKKRLPETQQDIALNVLIASNPAPIYKGKYQNKPKAPQQHSITFAPTRLYRGYIPKQDKKGGVSGEDLIAVAHPIYPLLATAKDESGKPIVSKDLRLKLSHKAAEYNIEYPRWEEYAKMFKRLEVKTFTTKRNGKNTTVTRYGIRFRIYDSLEEIPFKELTPGARYLALIKLFDLYEREVYELLPQYFEAMLEEPFNLAHFGMVRYMDSLQLAILVLKRNITAIDEGIIRSTIQHLNDAIPKWNLKTWVGKFMGPDEQKQIKAILGANQTILYSKPVPAAFSQLKFLWRTRLNTTTFTKLIHAVYNAMRDWYVSL